MDSTDGTGATLAWAAGEMCRRAAHEVADGEDPARRTRRLATGTPAAQAEDAPSK